MRVTQSMYYDNLYGTNNSKLNKELFDVNKQIASGLKIQYASDDVRTFTETMRLDNELTTIGQIKKSTESGYKVSNQTDVTMNEFTDSMNRMRTLLVQAANGTNDATSLDAIVAELKGIDKNLKSLANTSINGQYLFSGSAINTKPITDDGIYHGNNVAVSAFLGSNNQQQYNITGGQFFLGEELGVKREVTSNVVNSNLINGGGLSPQSTISELMGDKDISKVNQSHFYLRGTRSDGSSFKNIIDLDETATIDDLLKGIENSYASNTVNVSLSSSGQISVADKQTGSSKLDFHIVGAVDYNSDYTSGSAVPTDRAVVTDIDDLDSGKTDYSTATSSDFFVQDFSRSNLTSATGAATNIQGLVYDRVAFERTGSTLTSNAPQILKDTHYISSGGQVLDTISTSKENAFATDSTLLSEVADTKTEITPVTDPKTYTLAGTSLSLTGRDVTGAVFTAEIKLQSTSVFSIDTNSDGTVDTDYDIFNVDGSKVEPDKMTYRQLMDVMNMITTNQLPATTNSASDYHEATENANFIGDTSLSYDGKIGFKDFTNSTTKASISLSDTNSDDFSKNASIMTFNTNNALTIRDPKTDFFKTIDDMIKAVENYKINPDADAIDVRNVGISNAIAMMDDLQDHTFRMQSIAGAQSNTLSNSLERTGILEISTMTLRSSVIDTDLAESSLRLTQLSLNYQAMLSTVGKVSQLSLVNYL